MRRHEFPILEFDPEHSSLIQPGGSSGRASVLPERCVLTFFNRELQKLHQQKRVRQVKKLKSEMGSHWIYAGHFGGDEVALLHPGVGAPLAAGLFEETIALGCRKFVICGSAGVLDPQLAGDKLLVATAALRDEGVSYHYLPPAREVAAGPEAVRAIESTLQKHDAGYHTVKSWTTDAYYRETRARIARRRAEGCGVVEMEAAALFAVAQFRGVEVGAIFYASDDVSGESWRNYRKDHPPELRGRLIELAAEACLAM